MSGSTRFLFFLYSLGLGYACVGESGLYDASAVQRPASVYTVVCVTRRTLLGMDGWMDGWDDRIACRTDRVRSVGCTATILRDGVGVVSTVMGKWE